MKISIIGTGLIGGSIALAIKKANNKAIISGYDISYKELEKAKEIGVIDEISKDFQQACENADLIIFASPVEETKKLLSKTTIFNIKSTSIITDVGSTKKSIVEHAAKIFFGKNKPTFIGGHPMAGSHKAGVESSKAHLFENAYYILTPLDNTPPEKIEFLKWVLSGTGSRFITMTPDEHDYATAVVSHFPHLIACGLVRHVEKHAKKMPIIADLAAGGFKDITRIASSHPKMRSDIVIQNMNNLTELLNQWKETMNELEQNIKNDSLLYFNQTKKYRDGIPQREKGAIQPYHDIYVDIKDEPGVLAKITGILRGINISNLEILEIREGILGVLHIIFSNENDRISAKEIISKEGYKVYESL